MSFGLGFGYPKVVKSSGGGGGAPVGTVYTFLTSTPAPFTVSGGGNGGSSYTIYNSSGFLTNVASGLVVYDYQAGTTTNRGQGLFGGATLNNAPFSEDFTNVAYTPTGCTVTAAATTSTRNTLTGQKIAEDTSTGNHEIKGNTNGQAAGFAQITWVQAKAAERGWIYIEASATSFGYFNISTGAVGTITGGSGLIRSLGNGWYHCQLYANAADATTPYVKYGVATADGTRSYTGTTGSGIYVFAAGSQRGFGVNYFPAYFPNFNATQASTFQTTCGCTGANFTSLGITPNSGAFVVEMYSSGQPNSAAWWMTDGTTSNAIGVTIVDTTGLVKTRRVVAGVSSETTVSGLAWTPDTIFKVGVTWDSATLKMCVNNGAVSSVAATGTLPTLTTAGVMQFMSGHYTGWADSWIRRITTYNTALTNAQLQAATV